MKTLDVRSYALCSCVAAWVLAGCGGAQGQLGAPGTISQSVASQTSSGGDLLYVSDVSTNDVYMLSYPSGSLVGTLTGFGSPQGLCSDGAGDVFVTDAKDADIVEFAHGGTTPLQTLQGSARPNSCAVDSTTGNLAVSNEDSFVSIYQQAKGHPTNYSTETSAGFSAYDDGGNLYVDEYGQLSTGNIVQVLPSGGSSFENVSLNKFLGNEGPAGIQWYGNLMVVAKEVGYDYDGKVYRFKVKGTSGKHSRGFRMERPLNDFFIYESTFIATTGDYGKILYYDYPKGQGPTKTINEPGGAPFGVTVSVDPSGLPVPK
jgi:hypothetical protein